MDHDLTPSNSVAIPRHEPFHLLSLGQMLQAFRENLRNTRWKAETKSEREPDVNLFHSVFSLDLQWFS